MSLARFSIGAALDAALAEFPPSILEEHGSDILTHIERRFGQYSMAIYDKGDDDMNIVKYVVAGTANCVRALHKALSSTFVDTDEDDDEWPAFKKIVEQLTGDDIEYDRMGTYLETQFKQTVQLERGHNFSLYGIHGDEEFIGYRHYFLTTDSSELLRLLSDSANLDYLW